MGTGGHSLSFGRYRSRLKSRLSRVFVKHLCNASVFIFSKLIHEMQDWRDEKNLPQVICLLEIEDAIVAA